MIEKTGSSNVDKCPVHELISGGKQINILFLTVLHLKCIKIDTQCSECRMFWII